MKLIAAKGMRLVNPKRKPARKTARKVKRRAVRKGNPSPYKYLVSLSGTHLARFLTLTHAKQYAQALANKTGRQVRLTG
jgi:hypothetical protein